MLNDKSITTKSENDAALQSIVNKAADDWFTISPKYRTKERLYEHIGNAAQEAVDLCKEIMRREIRNVRI